VHFNSNPENAVSDPAPTHQTPSNPSARPTPHGASEAQNTSSGTPRLSQNQCLLLTNITAKPPNRIPSEAFTSPRR